MDAGKLQKHIFATYFNLRAGNAVLAFLFPLILWWGGVIKGIPLQDSMSAYYHAQSTDYKSMRDFFVGILFAIGLFLYLYKGYSVKENVALNLAGIFAWGVAIFPMDWYCQDDCAWFSMHGFCALSLFACMAFVCIRCASGTLEEMPDGKLKDWFKRIYVITGCGMILFPAIAWFLTVIFMQYDSFVFIAEATGIGFFALYWLTKSYEVSKSHVERKALKGEFTPGEAC